MRDADLADRGARVIAAVVVIGVLIGVLVVLVGAAAAASNRHEKRIALLEESVKNLPAAVEEIRGQLKQHVDAFAATGAAIEAINAALDASVERLEAARNVLGAVVSDPALLCQHGTLRGIYCAECEDAASDPRLDGVEDEA